MDDIQASKELEETRQLWQGRIGKFCIVDYSTQVGPKTGIGILKHVLFNRLSLQNTETNEEIDITFNSITSSRVQERKNER